MALRYTRQQVTIQYAFAQHLAAIFAYNEVWRSAGLDDRYTTMDPQGGRSFRPIGINPNTFPARKAGRERCIEAVQRRWRQRIT